MTRLKIGDKIIAEFLFGEMTLAGVFKITWYKGALGYWHPDIDTNTVPNRSVPLMRWCPKDSAKRVSKKTPVNKWSVIFENAKKVL